MRTRTSNAYYAGIQRPVSSREHGEDLPLQGITAVHGRMWHGLGVKAGTASARHLAPSRRFRVHEYSSTFGAAQSGEHLRHRFPGPLADPIRATVAIRLRRSKTEPIVIPPFYLGSISPSAPLLITPRGKEKITRAIQPTIVGLYHCGNSSWRPGQLQRQPSSTMAR